MLENSWSLPVLEKIITPTSASHKIASSFAFFSNPLLLFENVTCLLVELSILLITILPLPIPTNRSLINQSHASSFNSFIQFYWNNSQKWINLQSIRQFVLLYTAKCIYHKLIYMRIYAVTPYEREREREVHHIWSTVLQEFLDSKTNRRTERELWII